MSRNIRLPQAFSAAETQGYFMVTKQDAATVILHKLTGTQLRLWLYLMMLDSFADYGADGERIYHPLPSPLEMATQLGISVGRVEKEMRVLRKLGLYAYRVTAWQGHNLTAARAKLESERLKQNRLSNPELPRTQPERVKGGQNSPMQGQNSPPLPPTETPNGQSSPLKRQNSRQTRQNSPRSIAESPDLIEVSDRSQTIQTIQTLSDPKTAILSERESRKNWQSDPQFRDWLRERAQRLPQAPQFLEAWIDAQSSKESFQREFQASQNPLVGTNIPPSSPDGFQIESACLAAMEQGDRAYVRVRLQSLWEAGWPDLVTDLVQRYPAWNLKLTGSGVEEANHG